MTKWKKIFVTYIIGKELVSLTIEGNLKNIIEKNE